MKKKCLLFILIFLGIVLFRIDGVRADEFYIHYMGCKSLEGVQQSITIDTLTETRRCEDEDFEGWQVFYKSGDGKFHVYCTDGGPQPHEDSSIKCPDGSSYDLYSNGAKVSQTGGNGDNVYFTAFKSDGTSHVTDEEKAHDFTSRITDDKVKEVMEDALKDVYTSAKEAIKNSKVCTDYKTDETECKRNKCSWNKEYGFCSNDGLTYLKCGDANDFPSIVPKLSSYAVTLLKTVTPVVLIIFSIISLVKAMTSSKEEEIKKAQAGLIKRIIISALIFFVITIVQFIMLKVASSAEKDKLSSCLSCLLNGPSDCGSIYYKSGSGKCFYVKGGEFDCD